MGKYFIKRLGLMVITFIVIVYLFFLFVHLLPDNTIPNPEDITFIKEWQKEGRDKPITIQFFIWIKNIFKYKSFGFSKLHRRDSSDVLFSKIPATILFQLVPYLITVPLGITLGVIAALHKNKFLDNFISILIMILISLPTFVIAVLFQLLFVFKLNWVASPSVLPPSEFKLHPWAGIKSFILPTIVMVLGGIAGWARGIRAELTEQLTQEYMLLARAKGLTKRQATIRHALKNALVPYAPSIFLGFLGLISGSIILEEIFRVDGAGKVYLQAFGARDFNLLQLYIVFYNFIGLLSGVFADLSYTLLDPRMRVGSGRLQ